jgi:energy-coupling factor transporter ATP-binding protein EcfA2
MTSDDKVTYFAETDSRNKRVKFGIKAKDRTRHMYVIGKTGMGKSTLLENMAVQDIQSGEGLAFIDPHGKTADLLLNYVPEHRIKDVVYFAPFDTDYPISFNIMEDVGYDKRHLVVSGLMSTFKKIWVDAWSARMEYILSNTLLALLEYPGATLLGVNKMLADKEYRTKVVNNITDPAVRSFWVDEFAKYTEKFAAEATPAIQNKIGQFTNNPLIRNIIGQPRSSFDIRKMMDEKKILIINLSKGRVGDQNANLLGSMLITKIYLGAMSRADVSEATIKKLPQFYLYVDEFQNFANESFADILSEARKYKLNLTIAHQYIEQMEEEVRAAVFGNVGSMIAFRVGSFDAEVLEKEFAPRFTAEDIVNLGFAQIYLRLMIDGIGSQPFSATTIGPIAEPAVSYVPQILESSRSQFAQPRAGVEEQIKVQMAATVAEPKPDRRAQGVAGSGVAGSPLPSSSAPNRPPAPRSADNQAALRAAQQAFVPRPQPTQAPRVSTPVEKPFVAPAAVAPHKPSVPVAQPKPPVTPAASVPTQPRREEARFVPSAPPVDESGGFQSLKDLKVAAARPATHVPERKGVTAESRLDLRAALAAIAPSAVVSKPVDHNKTPPADPVVPKTVAPPPPVQPPEAPRVEIPKPQPVSVQTEKEKDDPREVPEHVLKKILEV